MRQIMVSGLGADGNRVGNFQLQIDKDPNECPICRTKVVPENVAPGFFKGEWAEMYYRCVNTGCMRSFIARYQLDQGLTPQGMRIYRLQSLFPVEPLEKAVSADILTLSPSFARIAAQARTAEEHGLDDVAGPGYRKAFEFLIKDYAISLQADDKAKEEIKKLQLGAVIEKYLTGDKLPIVSKRAAWLGNDETHYERRWIGKDLEDLKKLIEAVEYFIAMELLVKELPTEMPDPTTPAKS
jgi:hypothetical protein